MQYNDEVDDDNMEVYFEVYLRKIATDRVITLIHICIVFFSKCDICMHYVIEKELTINIISLHNINTK